MALTTVDIDSYAPSAIEKDTAASRGGIPVVSSALNGWVSELDAAIAGRKDRSIEVPDFRKRLG
jgi:hypothetical protein